MSISQRLLSIDNPKAAKSVEYGWLNAIHYMAPTDIAGVGNLCPHASPGCKAICLGYHSGQASFVQGAADTSNKNSVRISRDTKAQQFMSERKAYLAELAKQIGKARNEADANGLKLCVRLNGSTDVNWQAVYKLFPDVQFTEYTKDVRRMFAWLKSGPSNVHMTFSRSELNERQCLDVLSRGGNVAAVFEALPKTWHGYRVINGDKHDLRHLDPRGVVVGLTPKGAARKDQSGFVIRKAA